MSLIEDHMSENFVRICKATCQRCDVTWQGSFTVRGAWT